MSFTVGIGTGFDSALLNKKINHDQCILLDMHAWYTLCCNYCCHKQMATQVMHHSPQHLLIPAVMLVDNHSACLMKLHLFALLASWELSTKFLDDIIIIVCWNLDMDCKFDQDIFAFEPGKLIPRNVWWCESQ